MYVFELVNTATKNDTNEHFCSSSINLNGFLCTFVSFLVAVLTNSNTYTNRSTYTTIFTYQGRHTTRTIQVSKDSDGSYSTCHKNSANNSK